MHPPLAHRHAKASHPSPPATPIHTQPLRSLVRAIVWARVRASIGTRVSTRAYRYEAIVRINAQSGKGGLAYVLETE